MTQTVRLDIEYDGTGFAGWARQPGLPSIEGSLLEVLGRILQQDISLSVAGRTDAGVHARGQVASFRLDRGAIEPGKLRRSLNQLLPAAIVVTRVAEAPAAFDARHSALSRSYVYQILNRPYPSPFRARYVNYFPGRLDADLLDMAAALIPGRHDFTAFTPTVTEHADFERDVAVSEWRREGDLLVYRITAPGFLRNMVRVLAGTMLEIGRGYRPLEDLSVLLTGTPRTAAGETAPACGLFLDVVNYGI